MVLVTAFGWLTRQFRRSGHLKSALCMQRHRELFTSLKLDGVISIDLFDSAIQELFSPRELN